MSRIIRMLCAAAVALPFLSVAIVTAPAATRSAAAATIAQATRPKDFAAQSITWISPSRGWMLGSAPCGAARCTEVVATTNGAQTWHVAGILRAPLTQFHHTGVSGLRFANARVGWAFGPSLHATTDGGRTWTKEAVPGGGRRVMTLAADADQAIAVVNPCNARKPFAKCHRPVTIWRSSPPGSPWQQVGMDLPGGYQAEAAVHGETGYVVIPNERLRHGAFVASLDGVTWTPRRNPCRTDRDEQLLSVAPITDTRVALQCVAAIGFGKSAKHAYRSNDAASITRSAGIAPLLGITTQIAATPDGTIAMATSSIGSWIYRNAGGNTWTTPVDLGDGGEGWNDIGFTTDQTGFVVHGPEAFFGPGELWGTTDGGASWAPLPVRPLAKP
jgi:photosystem II stability/assembly factor-like uncharacterized protein